MSSLHVVYWSTTGWTGLTSDFWSWAECNNLWRRRRTKRISMAVDILGVFKVPQDSHWTLGQMSNQIGSKDSEIQSIRYRTWSGHVAVAPAVHWQLPVLVYLLDGKRSTVLLRLLQHISVSQRSMFVLSTHCTGQWPISLYNHML